MSPWQDCENPAQIAYSAEESREMDRWLCEERGFSISGLMDGAGSRLGEAVLELAAEHKLERVIFMVGPGNNGGDALVARALTAEIVSGEVWQPLSDGRSPQLDRQTLLVDGLFGVGLARPLEGVSRAAVELVLS
ncbi:MAG: NAD(P)H-hydrate repair Nnr-like enzyme with NAD(P)H-hydrate epimerase domain, partial [Pseudohongiellaceae bacterium]